MTKKRMKKDPWWNEERIAITKGMLLRGDSQQSVAAWWGGEINSGRINEIAKRSKQWVRNFDHVKLAPPNKLPPPGPYVSGHHAARALLALVCVEEAFERSIDKQQAALSALRRAMKALKDPTDD